MIYKLMPYLQINNIRMVQRLLDNCFIPFDRDNKDYQQFKSDITNGAELQDADGNVITPEQVQEFMKGLT